MLTTNLLPPLRQKDILRERWARITVFIASGIGSVLIAGIVLLFPSYLPLVFQRRELERAHDAVRAKAEELHVADTLVSIQAVHSFLHTIDDIDASHTSVAFLRLLSDAQGVVTLTQLSVRNQGDVTMNGYAATRDNLLQFEERLRENGYIQDIVSPLSNIVQESDINFVLQAKIK